MRDLASLRDRRERLHKLGELAKEVDQHLADLSHLIDRTPVIRDHEIVPPELALGPGYGELVDRELTPERIRERTPEEAKRLGEKRDRERAEHYRWVYGLLGLRVVAHGDGTLELTWRTGSKLLGPGEPRAVELPPPEYYIGALSVSSDSQR